MQPELPLRRLEASQTPRLRRFPKRIGFSGTPSDLLPMELGKCDYETGDDEETEDETDEK